MKINDAGRAIIKDNEGLRLDAYLCPSGVPTIGYGHTGDVKLGDRITEHQADVILELDLERFEEGVAEVAPSANQNQFSAMVSFAFNVGLKAFVGSALLRAFLAGQLSAAASQFDRWVHGGRKVLPGLVKRRAAEKALFLTPMALAVLLMGCGPEYHWTESCDRAQRERVFLSCVATIRSPESLTAAGNDLDEAIAECSTAAKRVACVPVFECWRNCEGGK